jgi:hypothetical protein
MKRSDKPHNKALYLTDSVPLVPHFIGAPNTHALVFAVAGVALAQAVAFSLCFGFSGFGFAHRALAAAA